MGAKGFNVCQDGHLVMQETAGHELNGADTHFPVINMENWNHIDYFVYFGVNPLAAAVITVESCSNWTDLAGAPTTATKIPFSYYPRLDDQNIAGNDVDGDRTEVTVAATGIIPTAGTTNILYIIPLDAEQLSEGHIGFRLDIVNAGAGCLSQVGAILSGARYAGDARPSVTTV